MVIARPRVLLNLVIARPRGVTEFGKLSLNGKTNKGITEFPNGKPQVSLSFLIVRLRYY